MAEIDLSGISPQAWETRELLQRRSGFKAADCCQCGVCSASCPFAPAMRLMPRQIVRCLQLGQVEAALESQTPWICASCHACSCRCPHGLELPALMEAIRQEARGQGYMPLRRVEVFNAVFMKTVRAFGRNHEMLMSAAYNLFSLRFWQDIRYAPALYFKGKIHILPRRIKNRAALRGLLRPYAQHLRLPHLWRRKRGGQL